MHNIVRIPLVLSGAVLCLNLAACQGAPAPEAQLSCEQTPAAIHCILQNADEALALTDDAFDRVSGAAELAIAYDTAGEYEQASVLIDTAIATVTLIEDTKQRGSALSEILTAIADMQATPKAADWVVQVKLLSDGLDAAKQADLTAKSIIVEAVHHNAVLALDRAIALPHAQDLEANAKAITLRKIAGVLAAAGDFKNAQRGIDAVTMSIAYYQAMVRSDVARYAVKAGRVDLADRLLSEADTIARGLDNGYFIGAALRDIGFSYFVMGNEASAGVYFEDAREAARGADKQNEKARAVSRIATRLSDAGFYGEASPVISESIALATDIESDLMKGYSYYEIAGAASFSGDFETARMLIRNVPDNPLGSTASVRSAAMRDLAWGLARHGEVTEAVTTALAIETQREKIHALSRIVRLLTEPGMAALPRYL